MRPALCPCQLRDIRRGCVRNNDWRDFAGTFLEENFHAFSYFPLSLESGACGIVFGPDHQFARYIVYIGRDWARWVPLLPLVPLLPSLPSPP